MCTNHFQGGSTRAYARYGFPGTSTGSPADYDAKYVSVWSTIVSDTVPYTFKARVNHLAAVKIVNGCLAKWCVTAAKRGWGGEYTPLVRREGEEKDAGGRFERGPVAKTKKLQCELPTFWKKKEKEEKEERRRREKERVEKARMELEKKEELRQRRKLEFLITQTELYSHLVGKRLKSTLPVYCTGLSLAVVIASQLESEDAEGDTNTDPALEDENDAAGLDPDIDDGLAEDHDGALDFDKGEFQFATDAWLITRSRRPETSASSGTTTNPQAHVGYSTPCHQL